MELNQISLKSYFVCNSFNVLAEVLVGPHKTKMKDQRRMMQLEQHRRQRTGSGHQQQRNTGAATVVTALAKLEGSVFADKRFAHAGVASKRRS